jgi:hypothetical protein
VLAILVVLPGVFSTTGDKRHVVVAVSGRIPLLIELILAIVAIYSVFLVWTYIGGAVVAVVSLVMFISGASRTGWLISNEPPDWPLQSK